MHPSEYGGGTPFRLPQAGRIAYPVSPLSGGGSRAYPARPGYSDARVSDSPYSRSPLSRGGPQRSATSYGRFPSSAQDYGSRSSYKRTGRSSLVQNGYNDNYSTAGSCCSDGSCSDCYEATSYVKANTESPTINGTTYIGTGTSRSSPYARSGSRKPSAAALAKYPSDCPGCAGRETYCYDCTPIPGKLTIRPEFRTRNHTRDSSPSPSSGTAIAPRRPGTLARPAGELIHASPFLEPLRVGDRRQPESPYGIAESATGLPIWCILDTGAASTSVSPSLLRRAFPGIKIFRDQTCEMIGIGGGSTVSRARVDLEMVWHGMDGRRVVTRGEAWVAKEGLMEGLGCDVLLGLPYMRDNGMDLKWSGVKRRENRSGLPQLLGDRLEIKGVSVEICITR